MPRRRAPPRRPPALPHYRAGEGARLWGRNTLTMPARRRCQHLSRHAILPAGDREGLRDAAALDALSGGHGDGRGDRLEPRPQGAQRLVRWWQWPSMGARPRPTWGKLRTRPYPTTPPEDSRCGMEASAGGRIDRCRCLFLLPAAGGDCAALPDGLAGSPRPMLGRPGLGIAIGVLTVGPAHALVRPVASAPIDPDPH